MAAGSDELKPSAESEQSWTQPTSPTCMTCPCSTGPGSRPGSRAGLSQAPGAGGPDRHTCWLATINPDGSPHVTGVGALWADGCFWFETGTGTRKGKNLARDRRCTLSVAAREFDLVVNGEATLVTDPGTVAGLAARWAEGGWPGPARRHGRGAHRRLQRALGRPAAVARVPAHTAYGHRGRHRRPRRRDALALLGAPVEGQSPSQPH